MCGSAESSLKAVIESTEMIVCQECANFGNIVKKAPFPKFKSNQLQKPPEAIQIIVPNFSQFIREGRDKIGLSQQKLADKLNEKESLIRNLEGNKHEPSIKLAEKIEKFLNIQLVETYEEKKEKIPLQTSGGLTIGDLIKAKK